MDSTGTGGLSLSKMSETNFLSWMILSDIDVLGDSGTPRMIRFTASSVLSCTSLAMSLRDGVVSVVDRDAAIFDKVFSVANIRVSSLPMSWP